MDFHRVLPKTKFLFDWFEGEADCEIEISDLNFHLLKFATPLSNKELTPPKVTISIKVRHYWHEHHFSQTSWHRAADGEVVGLELLGPSECLSEWKKNLEIGLCV